MPDRQVIRPAWPWAEKYRIAQGVRVGGTIYVAGQVAYRPDGSVAGSELPPGWRSDRMLAQARQVFMNIGEVLRLGGASMEDVVKLNAYLTDFSLFAGYAQARREVFPEPSFVGTGVEVKSLVSPELLLEVEAVAVAVP